MTRKEKIERGWRVSIHLSIYNRNSDVILYILYILYMLYILYTVLNIVYIGNSNSNSKIRNNKICTLQGRA